MRYLFVLSKENVELARDEAMALSEGSTFLDGNIFVVDGKVTKGIEKRLAYSRQISILLFHTSHSNFLKSMESYPWNDIYKKSFSLRKSGKSNFTEKELAGFIWRSVDNPVVDMKDADMKVEVHFTKNQVYCSLLFSKIEDRFEERKAHKRPKLHPTAMHPKLARAMVNLTGIKQGELYDPFCGSGGILIEAGLMGLKPIGYDIDKDMLKRAEENINHFNLKATLGVKDSTELRKDMRYIATDLPYGLNSKGADLEKLYLKFLKVLKKHLKKSAVIAFPDFVDVNKVISDAGFTIKKEYSYYLHKSLSKKIVVI